MVCPLTLVIISAFDYAERRNRDSDAKCKIALPELPR